MIDVLVYSKPGFCLCDELKAQLLKLQKTWKFGLRETNILENPKVFEQFHEEIPVVFINGKKTSKFHLNERRFLRQIKTLSSQKRPGENAT